MRAGRKPGRWHALALTFRILAEDLGERRQLAWIGPSPRPARRSHAEPGTAAAPGQCGDFAVEAVEALGTGSARLYGGSSPSRRLYERRAKAP